MTRISSKAMMVLPLIWFGIPAAALAHGFFTGTWRTDPPFFLVFAAVAIALSYLMFRGLYRNLADEVLDDGDALVVRCRGHEERVPLSNVMNVSADGMGRITLRLVTPGRSGSEITFLPRIRFSLNPFGKNPLAEDLTLRAHDARTRRAR